MPKFHFGTPLNCKTILHAARFSIEITIRDMKGHFGLGDYQSTTTIAFLRFVVLSCVACCIGRLLLHSQEADTWLEDISASPVHETSGSFAKLKRGLKYFVLRQLLFSKS
ncbi:MAG: hypothetical protein GY749_43855, partial [Desulfobacteraceae bacterium]|nr:hypothetical protein [Desulfobacteraceae bacterium]